MLSVKISKSPQEGTHILILPSRTKSLNETKEIFIEHYMFNCWRASTKFYAGQRRCPWEVRQRLRQILDFFHDFSCWNRDDFHLPENSRFFQQELNQFHLIVSSGKPVHCDLFKRILYTTESWIPFIPVNPFF